jgi:hypothetical protein
METDNSKTCCSIGSWWRLPLLLALVLGAILIWRGGDRWEIRQNGSDATNQREANSATQKVLLTINYGDGNQRIVERPWQEGLTVAELLSRTPGLATTQKGTGEGAFLTEIDGVANEGAAGNNWTYAVSGKSADRSYAVYKLSPGDRVLWTFGPPR